ITGELWGWIPSSDLHVGEYAVVVARADATFPLVEDHLAIAHGAAAIFLAAGHEHEVDPAVDVERPQRPGQLVLARPRDALGLAADPHPRVLKVRAPPTERGQPAQEADLVGIRGRVEVAAQDLRRAVRIATRADHVVDREHLALARDAVI